MYRQSLFISYAHPDIGQIKPLVETLRAGGYEPWFDFNLAPGQDWKAQLTEAIQKCDALIFTMTPESLASEWCWWELNQASQMEKPVIPIRLQNNIDVPKELTHLQWVDFSEGPNDAVSVAKLMFGLRNAITLPKNSIISIPQVPKGVPAQANTNTTSPIRSRTSEKRNSKSNPSQPTLQNSIEHSSINLFEHFNFTLEDLEVNRSGKMSKRQVDEIFIFTRPVLSIIAFLIVLTLIIFTLYASSTYSKSQDSIILIDLFFGIIIISLILDIFNKKQVEAITGSIKFKNSNSIIIRIKNSNAIIINKQEISISPKIIAVDIPGNFRCYYIKKRGTNSFLSIEPANSI